MLNMAFGHVFRADSPILVVAPHSGTQIPDALLMHPAWATVRGRLADPGGAALQTQAMQHDVSVVCARYHPCVIDCNVATDNRPLSQRLNRTGLCRTHTSRGEALYEAGREPSEAEVEARVQQYWRPFHAAVIIELLRLRQHHDNVLMLVSHVSSWLSPYRNQVDALDCNIGTHRGRSCDRRLVWTLTDLIKARGGSWVVNGKVADVFSAQRYGFPESGIHVVEMEIAGRWRTELERGRNDPGKINESEESGADAALRSLFETLTQTLTQLPPTQPLERSTLEADRIFE